MEKPSILVKKKLLFVLIAIQICLVLLVCRVFYLQAFRGEELQTLAYAQQTRDRLIAPDRGSILDQNMVPLATTETVASVSVIHSQIQDPEGVAMVLSEILGLEYDYVLEKVNKKVALERIKTKVDKQTADEIRALNMPGVVVDEDIKRVYPYSNLAAQVIGFVGKDNQGIIGLEAKYDQYLKGESGKILTETDVKGKEVKGGEEYRVAPKPGYNLVTSLDVVIQQYTEQTLDKVMEAKQAKNGAAIVMNPNTGEIYSMVSKPDFDLNEPFTINNPELAANWDYLTQEEQSNALNKMWRNYCINDTYEPGSTFKIFTSAAGLEAGVVTPDDHFICTGFRTVGGRQIKCWRYPKTHGDQTFVEGVYNSCNPVFMEVAERLGAETFYEYMDKFGFNDKTGIDLAGEAVGITHDIDDVGPVELATMSFGQSFQITPIQLITAACAVVNGGNAVTPHFGTALVDNEGNIVQEFEYPVGEQIISEETSEIMCEILEGVVYTGTGNKTYIPGYRIGGKTATSEKLPRKNGKYIASFLAFAPAENPEVIVLMIIDEPQGVYYGGQVVGPPMKELLENILPYLGIKPEYNEEEAMLPETANVIIPDFKELMLKDAQKIATELGLTVEVVGEGDIVTDQFPLPGDEVNIGTKVILYVTKSEQWEDY